MHLLNGPTSVDGGTIMAGGGFDHFYSSWFEQLQQLVRHLSSDGTPKLGATGGPVRCCDGHYNRLVGLVNKFMSHFLEFYRVKGVAVDRDVLSVVAAPWASTLERSLHWVAGWRPTTIFHLVYTESGIQFESHIEDILRGVRIGNLGDLSPAQFRRVSELQCDTVREENAISEELSQWQDGASELVVSAGGALDVDARIGQLARVVKKADNLRLKTLRSVVELLNPQQAAEFLVAVSELQFGIRAWGLAQDAGQA